MAESLADFAEYAPCLRCGGRSLAAMVDHICEDCEDVYRLCLECQPCDDSGASHV